MNSKSVSVIIPIQELTNNLIKCIKSVKNQSFKDNEIIIISPTKINFGDDVKIVIFSGTKTKARNTGALKARGEYILYLDDDMCLEKEVISECVKNANKYDALIIPELAYEKNFRQKCRNLEKKIVLNDKNVEAPRFLSRKLFNTLGEFDEEVDPLDEQSIDAKLKIGNYSIGRIKSKIFINHNLTFMAAINKKYKRGQVAKLFETKYPGMHQFIFKRRILNYFKNIKYLFLDPVHFLGLIFLKLIDYSSFKYGMLKETEKIKQLRANINNKTIFENEAKSYENEFYKKTMGARYVDKKEKRIVLNMLKIVPKDKKLKILDLGMGPGRWSRLMLDAFPNSAVYGVDLSGSMVKIAKENLSEYGNRFKAVQGDMSRLHFKDNEFDIILNIRAIKYVQNYKKVLAEMNRVSKDGCVQIIEFPKNNIYLWIAKLLTFGKLRNYANRIKTFNQEEITKIGSNTNILVEFKIPATFYKLINNNFLLLLTRTLEKILPKKLFGRSIFIKEITYKKNIKNNVLVSVIIPTKNSSKTLDGCLSSIKNQSYKNIEIIIVDNNSTDNTKKIARKYTKFVFNKGPERSAQRNFGAIKSLGEFVYLVDADFVLEKEVVKQCLEQASLGFDAVVVHNSPDVRVSWIAKIRKFEVDMYKYDLTHSAARFFEKSVFLSIKGYNPRVTAGEDYDIQNRLNQKKYHTGFIDAEAIHLGEPTSFWQHMRKYYDYGKDFNNYRKYNPEESKTQLSFFRKVYFKNWKKFIWHPMKGTVFMIYHAFKFTFSGAGYIMGKMKW